MSDLAMGSLDNYLSRARMENTTGTNLSSKLKNTDSNTSAKELKDACKQFESYFIEQMYKEMLKTVNIGEGDSSMAQLVDYFKDETVQTIADQTMEQSGGTLAKQMYEQMRRNYGIAEAYNEV